MVKLGLVIPLALLFGFGVSGYAQSETPKRNADSDTSAQQSSNASDGAPAKQPGQPVEGTANPASQQKTNESSAFSYKDKLDFGLSLALFLVVIVQVFIAYRQNQIADQQRQIMQKQIDMAETTERGYMGIGDMKVSNLAVGQRPTVTVKWVNGGRTPVRNFRAMPILVFGKEPVTNKMYFIDDDISPISGSFFPVGAERDVPYPQTDKITEADIAGFENGSLNVYIIGNLFYRDVSGARRVERISAVYDRYGEYVYETYEYSGADS